VNYFSDVIGNFVKFCVVAIAAGGRGATCLVHNKSWKQSWR